MPNPPPTILDELLSLSRVLRSEFECQIKQQNLTYSRARLLMAIGRNPGFSQAELAAQLQIETPTLKRLLDALESQGLAERRPLQSDARKHAIYVTDSARLEPLKQFRSQMDAALIDGISTTDLATTRQVLAAMTRNAEGLHEA